MSKVLVLGGSGMLGSMVVDWLARDRAFEVGATVRAQRYLESGRRVWPKVRWHLFDVEANGSSGIPGFLKEYNWIINAIGVIKPFIRDDNPVEIERALRVNAVFPYQLAREAERYGVRVLQIGTDCVYSGGEGNYTEDALHDPPDVYGKTKSLGEVHSGHVYHLRCSIIGPEPKGHISLLDWFLRQPLRATVKGFTNHRWNGVTTLHFAKLCGGIIQKNLELPWLHHIVPDGVVTKAEMLNEFARHYGRQDIQILSTEASQAIDRTLRTKDPALNQRIWEAAGYPRPFGFGEMIEEMRAHDFRLGILESEI